VRNRADILIRGGLIYDGTLSEPRIGDVAAEGDRITYVGPADQVEASVVIDAKDLAVCPGFIDTHAHSDFTIVADNRAEGKIMQGVTTEVNGNCGMSAAPLYNGAYERRDEDLRELGITERWNTLGQYFDLIRKKGTAVNIATLAGHGNIRGSVVGYDDKSPSPEEMKLMLRLLRESIDEGAIGLSTGLIYPPGIYAQTEELIELGQELVNRDLVYASHMRSEGTMLLEAVREVIRIGREAGIRVHISHLKTAGRQNWHKAGEVIALLQETLRGGGRLTCDRYPYTASSTDLDAVLPSWTYAGGNDEELRKLQNERERVRITRELEEQAQTGNYWNGVIISSVSSKGNRWMEGKTVSDIARTLGIDEISAVFRVLIEERLRVGAIFLSMSEDNLRKFLSLPFCMIGSDSSARCFDGLTRRGKPHPRTFGTFPRFFGRYVRDEALIPFPEAFHRATQLAAETFGLKGRGRIAEGMYADIVIFDPARIADNATFEEPFQRPAGIRYVLVNGRMAVEDGQYRPVIAGKVLKSGGFEFSGRS
jgi:N-acyl-D-amino-acid deacylase